MTVSTKGMWSTTREGPLRVFYECIFVSRFNDVKVDRATCPVNHGDIFLVPHQIYPYRVGSKNNMLCL
jgi:hypothetical protein